VFPLSKYLILYKIGLKTGAFNRSILPLIEFY
jgi:hypothetical protein